MSFRLLEAHRPIVSCRCAGIARCYRIATTQHADGYGSTWRLTDSPREITVTEEDGSTQTYAPTVLITPDAREMAAQFGERSTKLEIDTGTPATFSVDDGRRGLLEASVVTQFDVFWRFPWLPPLRSFQWRVARIDPLAGSVRLDLVGISSELQKEHGDKLSPPCANEFADALCDLGTTVSADVRYQFRNYKVSSVAARSRRSFDLLADTDSFPTVSQSVADWFAHGVIEFKDGKNRGWRGIVEANTQPDLNSPPRATFTLVTPLPFVPEADATVRLRVGCDRRRTTCRTKFALTGKPNGNLDNFRGIDLQPGSDLLRKTPDAT